MTERSRLRRAASCALAAAVLLPTMAYLAMASNAVATVRAARTTALLAPPVAGAQAKPISVAPAIVERAIAARPFDQGTVNVAMAQAARRSGDRAVAAWLPTVAQMGWRDTAAMQNRLYVAATSGDLDTLIDVSDALLRRRQLVDQVMPVLALVELEPRLRGILVGRLAGKPTWRELYIGSTGILQKPEQAPARYAMLRELSGRGDKLTDSELATNVAFFERQGLHGQSLAILRSMRPGVLSPLNDPTFHRAAAMSAAGDEPMPFDWQLLTGAGFGTDAVVEDGRSALEIQWNGRGVPIFAQQRTSARPGRHTLDVDIAPGNVRDLSALRFQLACKDTVVDLAPIGTSPQRLTTVRSVPCAFPMLQISGDIQSASIPRTLVIHALRLRPIA